jgi:uncharacterized protein
MHSRTDGSLHRDKYVKILTVPGLYDSGPEHWQSRWEHEFLEVERITQRDWNRPICAEWIAEVDKAVTTAGPATVVLAAHSLGCATVVHWAKVFNRAIRGALLVAPSDVEAPSYPPGTAGFVPIPLEKLPFTSIVVASSNDPYVAVDRARFFADSWGSEMRGNRACRTHQCSLRTGDVERWPTVIGTASRWKFGRDSLAMNLDNDNDRVTNGQAAQGSAGQRSTQVMDGSTPSSERTSVHDESFVEGLTGLKAALPYILKSTQMTQCTAPRCLRLCRRPAVGNDLASG